MASTAAVPFSRGFPSKAFHGTARRRAWPLLALLVAAAAPVPPTEATSAAQAVCPAVPGPGDAWWVREVRGEWAQASAAAFSPDEARVYAAGYSGAGSALSYRATAHDALTGGLLWEQSFPGDYVDAPFGNGEEPGPFLAASPDGGKVYVAGRPPGGPGLLLVALDTATGARAWSAAYAGSAPLSGTAHWDSAYGVAASPDGARVFVAGIVTDPTTKPDYVTLAYDAATGDQLWEARYNNAPFGSLGGNPNAYDLATAMALSPDGATVYVAGKSEGDAATRWSYDYATVAYDALTGDERWVRRYDSREGKPTPPGWPISSEEAQAVRVSPDGDTVLVSGSTYAGVSQDSESDFATVAYDAAGALRWAALYDGGDTRDNAYDLALAPDGSRAYVTGEGSIGGVTVAYDAATGAQVWAATDLDAFPGAVAAGPDRVYVAGDLAPFHAIAYDARTGATLDRLRESTVEDVTGIGVAVSPDGGRMVVAGIGGNDATLASSPTPRSLCIYRVELRAWIPHARVVDPGLPMEEGIPYVLARDFVDGAVCHQQAYSDFSTVHGWFKGDGHAGYDGSYRVRSVLEFEWDGTAIRSARTLDALGEPAFGETQRWRRYVDLTHEESCILERGTATTLSTAALTGPNSFRLEYSSSNPIQAGSPAIDGWLEGDLDATGRLHLRFQTDEFPSHGFQVTRNGVAQLTMLSTDASCFSDAEVTGMRGFGEIFLGLVSEQTERSEDVDPGDAGRFDAHPSEGCTPPPP